MKSLKKAWAGSLNFARKFELSAQKGMVNLLVDEKINQLKDTILNTNYEIFIPIRIVIAVFPPYGFGQSWFP
jgi:hypothetical protein